MVNQLTTSVLVAQSAEDSRSKVLQELKVLGQPTVSSSLIPVVSIKAEILRRNPSLGTDAQELLRRSGAVAATRDEFHILFDYFFLLDDHRSIRDLCDTFDRFHVILDHLDFDYLLPAFLNERLGNRELAAIGYRRYFEAIRELSIRFVRYYDLDFSLRLSTTRIKLLLLEGDWRPPRDDYYEISYFSYLQNGFFSAPTLKSEFLAPYVGQGLLRPSSDVSFDVRPFRSLADQLNPADNPFVHYELCSLRLDALRWGAGSSAISNDGCRLDTLLDTLPHEHVVYWLTVFLDGRLLHFADRTVEARERYRELFYGQVGMAEFLRDDALFFEAMSYYDDGDNLKASQTLERLVVEFGTGGYDAVGYAKGILETRTGSIKRRPEEGEEILRGWRVQVGAFSSMSRAATFQATLKLKPLNPKIQHDQLFKVYYGPFATESEAREVVARLASQGVDSFVVHP